MSSGSDPAGFQFQSSSGAGYIPSARLSCLWVLCRSAWPGWVAVRLIGCLKTLLPSSLCPSPGSLTALLCLSFSQSLCKAATPLLQMGEAESAGVVFQHLIKRPSAGQAAEFLPCALLSASGKSCLWQHPGVMLRLSSAFWFTWQPVGTRWGLWEYLTSKALGMDGSQSVQLHFAAQF